MKTIKKDRNNDIILDIELDSTNTNRVLSEVRDSLKRKQKLFIVTPNPEIILLAQKDKDLKRVLNSADIAIPDGVGILLAQIILSQKNKLNIIHGRNMFLELCKLANKKAWKIFLLGGRNNVAEKTAQNLKQSLKKVKFHSTDGPMINNLGFAINDAQEKIEAQAIKNINAFSPEILFVGFGAPKQEKWSRRWFDKLDVGVIMVVGGTFDYFSKETPFPPKFFERAGLEWFWRLFTQPRRVKRIFKAVVVFPLTVLAARLGLYRSKSR